MAARFAFSVKKVLDESQSRPYSIYDLNAIGVGRETNQAAVKHFQRPSGRALGLAFSRKVIVPGKYVLIDFLVVQVGPRTIYQMGQKASVVDGQRHFKKHGTKMSSISLPLPHGFISRNLI